MTKRASRCMSCVTRNIPLIMITRLRHGFSFDPLCDTRSGSLPAAVSHPIIHPITEFTSECWMGWITSGRAGGLVGWLENEDGESNLRDGQLSPLKP